LAHFARGDGDGGSLWQAASSFAKAPEDALGFHFGFGSRFRYRYRDRDRDRSRPPENPHPSVILFILSIHVDEFLGVLKPPARRITDMDEQDEQDRDRTDRGHRAKSP
jgi:hypothetical protein